MNKEKRSLQKTLRLLLFVSAVLMLLGAASVQAAGTGVMLLSHRGYMVKAPENTVEAYKQSAKAGYTYIECDVQESSDGSFFMMHDTTVDRTTNGKGRIQDKTAKQIKALRVDAGNGNPSGTVYRVPTLKEMLEVCKTYKLIPVIHFKGIKNYTAFDKICRKYSFYRKIIFMADVKSAKKYRTVNSSAVIMGVNYKGTKVVKSLSSYTGAGMSILNINTANLNSETYAALKKDKNVEGCAWFVNDLSVMYKAYKNGVRYFVTDKITPAKWEKYAAEKKAESTSTVPNVTYKTYVQGKGWTAAVKNGKTSGTIGQSRRIEGFTISLEKLPYAGGITYRAHMQGSGWSSWMVNGAQAGAAGRGLRIEAVQIKLTGTIAKYYDIYYRAHTAKNGWMGWVKNGATAGTTGQSLRMEAIEIKLVKKS